MDRRKCVVCGKPLEGNAVKYCSKECRVAYVDYYRYPKMSDDIESIKNLLKEINEFIRCINCNVLLDFRLTCPKCKRDYSRLYYSIMMDIKWIGTKLARLCIHFPDIANKIGIAVDGVPKMLNEKRPKMMNEKRGENNG